MSNTNIEIFKKNKFLILRNFLDPHLVKFLASYYRRGGVDKVGVTSTDWTSRNAKGDACADTLMYMIRSAVEENTGLELLPTYSFMRDYKKGDTLGRHKDGAANQVSFNVCIARDIDWELGFGDGETETLVVMEPGDAVIYQGFNLDHWREKYQGKSQIQVIVGFIIKDGEFDAHKFYGRPEPLYIPTSVKRAGPVRLMKGVLFRIRENFRRLTGQATQGDRQK